MILRRAVKSESLSLRQIPSEVDMFRYLTALATCLVTTVPVLATDQATNRWAAGTKPLTIVVADADRRSPMTPLALALAPAASPTRFGERMIKVQQANRRGSLRRAAIVGAAVGAAIGLFTVRFADCPDVASTCPGSRAAGFLLVTGIGAGIGVAIHALH